MLRVTVMMLRDMVESVILLNEEDWTEGLMDIWVMRIKQKLSTCVCCPNKRASPMSHPVHVGSLRFPSATAVASHQT